MRRGKTRSTIAMIDGKIEISMCRSTGTDDMSFHLRVTDETSRVIVVDAHIPLADAMLAITGGMLSDVPARFGDLSLVGREHVHTDILVELGRTTDDRSPKARAKVAAIVDAAVAKLERERPGHDWHPRYEDAHNRHCRQPDGRYRVTVIGHAPRKSR